MKASIVVLVVLAAPTISKTCLGALNVELIVDPDLYSSGQITANLNRYVEDLRYLGYSPILTTTSFFSPQQLRSHLADRYSTTGLVGTVLIGDLPISHFERDGQFGDPSDYERFACDLYYMDLDGAWDDSSGNGTYDEHTGNVAPEIWVGRMTTSPLTDRHPGRTEAGLLNAYFEKSHRYLWGEMSLPQRGLAYCDDPWASPATAWGDHLGLSVGGNVDVIKDPMTTTAADYKNRLDPSVTTGYQSVLVAAHAGHQSNRHAFKLPGDGEDAYSGGFVYSSGLEALDPQAFFYNLYTCSAADYESAGYLGGEYVFGTASGLIAVGSTKIGGMRDFPAYYSPLGDGKSFGEAYLNWWSFQATWGFGDQQKDWFYGMTLIGDPLLSMQQIATTYWQVGHGDWSVDSNWSDGVPTSSNRACINNAGKVVGISTANTCKD